MSEEQGNGSSISVAITGSGGAGVMTAGDLLLQAAARAGLYGLLTRSVGPQIRGGESAALLRIAGRPVETHSGAFDVVLALDWNNFSRFAAEIRLTPETLVLSDPESGAPPEEVRAATQAIVEFPAKEIADAVEGGRVNMVALGLLCAGLGIDDAVLTELIAAKLSAKGDNVVSAAIASVQAGRSQSSLVSRFPAWTGEAPQETGARWLLTGNEAAGLGAIRGGVQFTAAYPITPATEILEWLAPALARTGGTLVQAEDELASINMIIGASFGGAPALTATSGPGFALMTESIGLAAASEVPIVVIDVMRGGPSTGIPTKSEQSDLNIALYGLHGDAPHVVVAPVSLADCLFTTQWAVHLAEAMQTPAIVLSDQFLGQTRMIVDRPADVAFMGQRRRAAAEDEGFARYALTADGISPMSVPGTAGCQYTADGLAHAVSGAPSSRAEDHEAQLAKRRTKIEDFDYGSHWAEIEGSGEHVILTWGSSAAPVREAAARARAVGIHVKTVAVRLLAPLQEEALLREIEGSARILTVEQNESGQFYRYLRSRLDLPIDIHALHHPGPLPVTPDEIYSEIVKDHTL